MYEIYLNELKKPIYPEGYQQMEKKQITILYVLSFLIGFISMEKDSFYN